MGCYVREMSLPLTHAYTSSGCTGKVETGSNVCTLPLVQPTETRDISRSQISAFQDRFNSIRIHIHTLQSECSHFNWIQNIGFEWYTLMFNEGCWFFKGILRIHRLHLNLEVVLWSMTGTLWRKHDISRFVYLDYSLPPTDVRSYLT